MNNRQHITQTYHWASLVVLSCSVVLALLIAWTHQPVDESDGVVNAFGFALLHLVPACIACAPFLFNRSDSLHRVTWAGGGLLALVATGLLVLIVEPDSQLWFLSIGEGVVLVGFVFALWMQERSERERRIGLIVVRVLGALLIAVPAVSVIIYSLPSEAGFYPTSFIVPSIVLVCAALFAFDVRAKGFPLGYALFAALGIVATLAMGFGNPNLFAAVWFVVTVCAASSMAALVIDASLKPARETTAERPAVPA